MFKHKKFMDNEEKEIFINDVNSIKEFIAIPEYKALLYLCEDRELTKQEFLALCYLDKDIYDKTDNEDSWDIYDCIINYVKDVIYDIIDTYDFEEIDDLNKNYPEDLYHTGYKYGDIEIYDGYTGAAGHYWETLFK